MKLKILLLETRPQFLTLSVALAFLGTTIAWFDGYFDIGRALLAGIGLVLAHISVNTLNDYFDYRSGIDLMTPRTPFSGGSGILKEGLLKPSEVLWLGLVSLLLAVPIGIYFIYLHGWLLLPLLLVAGFCVILYSPLILKNYWPEWAPGVGLGVLPILGMYFAQTGSFTWHALIASVPSGFLVHNLLLLNEFPDVEADKHANRRTLPITIGGGPASVFYSAVTIMVYLWVIIWVVAGRMPVFALLALVTLPIAIRATRRAGQYRDLGKLIPGMADNVLVVLLTQIFLGIGYILATVF